jgi:rRNA-processing protein FCF1
MRVIINDANILIDLVKLDLIDDLLLLEFDFKITDFVLDELNIEQHSAILEYIEEGYIDLIITDNLDDLDSIGNIYNTYNGISLQDASVWHYAEKYEGILLSGDKNLRKQATNKGLEVRGILYIFDELLLANVIPFDEAIYKLDMLYRMNSRLPLDAKNERIAKWQAKEHVR